MVDVPVTGDGGADDWRPLLDDLEDRRRTARSMGGPEKIARRRDSGSLDARARIGHLLDPGSFIELGTLVGRVPADGLVAGSGEIEGRPVMVGAEDFTVLGGSIGAGSSAKRFRIGELAELDRIPLESKNTLVTGMVVTAVSACRRSAWPPHPTGVEI